MNTIFAVSSDPADVKLVLAARHQEADWYPEGAPELAVVLPHDVAERMAVAILQAIRKWEKPAKQPELEEHVVFSKAEISATLRHSQGPEERAASFDRMFTKEEREVLEDGVPNAELQRRVDLATGRTYTKAEVSRIAEGLRPTTGLTPALMLLTEIERLCPSPYGSPHKIYLPEDDGSHGVLAIEVNDAGSGASDEIILLADELCTPTGELAETIVNLAREMDPEEYIADDEREEANR